MAIGKRILCEIELYVGNCDTLNVFLKRIKNILAKKLFLKTIYFRHSSYISNFHKSFESFLKSPGFKVAQYQKYQTLMLQNNTMMTSSHTKASDKTKIK